MRYWTSILKDLTLGGYGFVNAIIYPDVLLVKNSKQSQEKKY